MSKLVKAAQAGGKMGKTAPAGGGKDTMPKGDGLKAAWGPVESRGKMTKMDAAKMKTR
jgi:hypothetical protein